MSAEQTQSEPEPRSYHHVSRTTVNDNGGTRKVHLRVVFQEEASLKGGDDLDACGREAGAGLVVVHTGIADVVEMTVGVDHGDGGRSVRGEKFQSGGEREVGAIRTESGIRAREVDHYKMPGGSGVEEENVGCAVIVVVHARAELGDVVAYRADGWEDCTSRCREDTAWLVGLELGETGGCGWAYCCIGC